MAWGELAVLFQCNLWNWDTMVALNDIIDSTFLLWHLARSAPSIICGGLSPAGGCSERRRAGPRVCLKIRLIRYRINFTKM